MNNVFLIFGLLFLMIGINFLSKLFKKLPYGKITNLFYGTFSTALGLRLIVLFFEKR